MVDTSFLPEDYLAQRAERRTNIICLSLFALVMGSVFLVFLWSTRASEMIKREQRAIEARYEAAAEQIKQLQTLEEQQEQMVERARLASALVERVPRSILLAEIINRMPRHVSLMKFELQSDEIRDKKPATGKKGNAPRRARTKREAQAEVNEVKVPRYRVAVALTGVAMSDSQVASFVGDLNGQPLLENVTLHYSETTDIDEREMREFNVSMVLSEDADVRAIEPLRIARRRMHTESGPAGAMDGALWPGLRKRFMSALEN